MTATLVLRRCTLDSWEGTSLPAWGDGDLSRPPRPLFTAAQFAAVAALDEAGGSMPSFRVVDGALLAWGDLAGDGGWLPYEVPLAEVCTPAGVALYDVSESGFDFAWEA